MFINESHLRSTFSELEHKELYEGESRFFSDMRTLLDARNQHRGIEFRLGSDDELIRRLIGGLAVETLIHQDQVQVRSVLLDRINGRSTFTEVPLAVKEVGILSVLSVTHTNTWMLPEHKDVLPKLRPEDSMTTSRINLIHAKNTTNTGVTFSLHSINEPMTMDPYHGLEVNGLGYYKQAIAARAKGGAALRMIATDLHDEKAMLIMPEKEYRFSVGPLTSNAVETSVYETFRFTDNGFQPLTRNEDLED